MHNLWLFARLLLRPWADALLLYTASSTLRLKVRVSCMPDARDMRR